MKKTSRSARWQTRTLIVCTIATAVAACPAETLPSQLQGSWRIAKLIPTTNQGCWDQARAQFLVGTTLTYSQKTMRWQGGDIPLTGIISRIINDNDLKSEFDGDPKPADFSQLQIKDPLVQEINLQHEDADITGASTEVPGDSVLLAGPNRLIGSACGVYFEAQRIPAPRRPAHR